jgi:hypothetical protein
MSKQLIHFSVYQGKDKDWYWHAWRSGKLTADGGEGYTRCASAYRAVRAFVTSVEIGKYVIEKQP